jgi:hypothetical protein
MALAFLPDNPPLKYLQDGRIISNHDIKMTDKYLIAKYLN